MSSWLSIPISNPFKSDSDNEEEEDLSSSSSSSSSSSEEEDHHNQQEIPSPHAGGVKENLSEIGKNLSRQLWGVASFLAPPPVVALAAAVPAPPTTSDSTTDSSSSSSSSQTLVGIRNDFAEISGSFKSSLSLLVSSTKAVNEISRLATNLLQFPKEEDTDDLFDDIVGITDEILEFVRVMSTRPECWTDFPLSLDDNNDFHMSDAQIEHSSTIEQLIPSLEALRLELCPSRIDEGRFWMIYFILLHPRLNYQDSLLLSTPQIVEARDVLLQNLRQRRSTELQSSSSNSDEIEESSKGSRDIGLSSNVDVSSKGSIGDNITVEQKEVLAETVNTTSQGNTDKQENADQWLEEEEEVDTETRTSFGSRKQQLGNEEDVSFSDLEDDDDNDESSRPARSTPGNNSKGSPPHDGSSGWVQLSENSDNGASRKKDVQPNSREKDSSGEESNDWLTVDDFDEDSVGTA